MPSKSPRLTHAIFDMDGVLLKTEEIYTRVTQKIVSSYGKTFDWAIKKNMIGRPALDAAEYLVKELDLPISPEEYLKKRNHQLKSAFRHSKAHDGAKSLISFFSHHNIPIALATSSDHEMYQAKTQKHKSWFSLFDAVICGDDPAIKKGKPAPDIFLLAQKKIGNNDSETCFVFEDSPSGATAGVAANMQVVVLKPAELTLDDYPNEVLTTLHSLTKFDTQKYGLPPFNHCSY